MEKAKIYQRIGKTCLWLWVCSIVLLALLLVFNKTFWSGEGPRFLLKVLISFILSILNNCLFNPFLFLAGVFFWRAARNRVPPEKSGWLGFIITYIIVMCVFISMAVIAVGRFNKARKRALQQAQNIQNPQKAE